MVDSNTLTLDKLRLMVDLAENPVYWHRPDNRGENPLICNPNRIVYSLNALVEDHARRRFPESKHRSKRIHKKLVKRFGGEYYMKPAMLRVSSNTMEAIVAHPAFKMDIERKLNYD